MTGGQHPAFRLQIQSIGADEIGPFAELLTEAAVWLRQTGRDMWDERQFAPARLLEQYKPEQLYVGRFEDSAAAAMILLDEDRLFWPGANPGESLFLHKLAVGRRFAGKGFAHEMLSWAKMRAASQGRRFLRLDCASDRPKLCTLYERNGFVKVGERLVLDVYPTAFYEWEVQRAQRTF